MQATRVERAVNFEQALIEHTSMLYAVALTLTRSAVPAERLARRTLAKALRSQDEIEAGTYIKAWLLTTLRNLFIADCRESSRRSVTPRAEIETAEDVLGSGAEAIEECCVGT